MRRGGKSCGNKPDLASKEKAPPLQTGGWYGECVEMENESKNGSYLKHPGRQCPHLTQRLENKLTTKTVSKSYIYNVYNALRSQGHIVFVYNFTWVWWPAMDLKGVILQSQFHNTVLNLEIPIKPTIHSRALLSFPLLSHMESEIIPAAHGFLF